MESHRPILLPYQKEYLHLCDTNRCVIVRKGRQSGFSLTLALWAVRERFRKKTNCYYVSRTERTASQFARYCKLWCEVLNITVGEEIVNLRTDATQTIIKFPNGSFIQCMPSGPDVVRGLPGTILWDEAGFAPDAQAFYDATFPAIQAGHSFHIISTVGPVGCFYEEEWMRAINGKSVFKPFQITMTDAINQGLADYMPGDHRLLPQGRERNAAFLDFIKRGMSEEAYLSEYECVQRGVGNLITIEEYEKQALCDIYEDMQSFDKARKEKKTPIGELYVGIDPAFSHDTAAIWVIERHYDPTPDIPDEYRDVYTTAVVKTWQKISPRALHVILRQYLSHDHIVKVLVDQGGPGYQLAMDLHQEYGGMVEPQAMTNTIKQESYERVKYFLQADRLGLPKGRIDIREEFLAICRKMTPGGQVTYEARIGQNHGDTFSACSLALHGAERDKAKTSLTTRISNG